MLKKICAFLLVSLSFCCAANVATFAYYPFPTEGLVGDYQGSAAPNYAYSPSTVYHDGVFHQFYCSTGRHSDHFINPWHDDVFYKISDHIRYRTSKDGVNWSAPRVVVTAPRYAEEVSACDPSVVKGDDGYWYMLYGWLYSIKNFI